MDWVANQDKKKTDNFTAICTATSAGGQFYPGLTRVRSIRFLLFEIKRVLVYNSKILKLTDLFILDVYADKKVFKKKD